MQVSPKERGVQEWRELDIPSHSFTFLQYVYIVSPLLPLTNNLKMSIIGTRPSCTSATATRLNILPAAGM